MLKYIELEAQQDGVALALPDAPTAIIEKVSRRKFLKAAGGAGGLVLGLQLVPGAAMAFTPYKTGAEGMPHKTVVDPKVFVTIAADGMVTLIAHRSEMGTGARTYVPMVLAEELDADWSRVKLQQAEGDEPKYGNQDTDGSRSLRHYLQPMRQMGASVRHMLEAAAAKKWGVDAKKVKAMNHEIHMLGDDGKPNGKKVGYGDVAADAMAMDVPKFEELSFKKDEEFRYMGKGEIPLYDLHDITTGKAKYGADFSVDGMKFAVVARPPVVGAKVKSVDSSAAMKVPGVEKVVQLPGSMPPAKFAPLGGVAVVASNTWAAIKGRDALKIEWTDSPHDKYDSKTFMAEMHATAKQPGKVMRKVGDPEAAFKGAKKVFSQEYSQAHMQHAQMEPLVAVADFKDGKVNIWAPVQSPYGARTDTAAALGLKPEDVTVNVSLLGGGFGRKSKCDWVIEAAMVSKEVGAPIKLQWTREDDIKHSFYHTTSVERLEAALDADNKVVGWRHRSVSPTIFSTFVDDPGYTSDLEAGMGLVDTPIGVANMSVEAGKAMAHTRIGWFRSVSNIPRAWAVQSFITELAIELGRDPKDMLIELIGPDRKIDPTAADMKNLWNYGEPYEEFPNDTARLRGVIELAAQKSGWGGKLAKGEGIGIAAHRSFVTYVASVVKVKVADDGSISIP
ncbi:MAG: molybdopterin cofactor-binding domain-containing protein, partial [Burkholderiaceae bacterium]